jgi:uncharacterized protein
MNIEHEQSETEGRFLVRGENGVLAFLHYERAGDVLRADETFVSETLRGQGVAGKLLRATVDFARDSEARIEPVCSYVVRAFERDPSLGDLRAA